MFHSAKDRSWTVLFSLIFAGEMIFSLPFHVPRYFRPTFLESFNLTNADLGDSFAIYGLTAMICYFPGGLIADLFSARRLLTASLVATALGGIYLAQIPTGAGLYIVFGYWGITTILMFWSGMIKATRDWGGNTTQGRAFGLLDGGRGLVAALMSTIAVLIFARILGTGSEMNQKQSIQAVIYFYSAITALAALFIWRYIPETKVQPSVRVHPFKGMTQVMTSSRIWLQAGIIICAYCAYKGLDNYGLYAVQVLSMDQIEAATFTSIAAYLRPVGAVAAGILADRFKASKVILWNFIILTVLFGSLSIRWSEALLFNLAMFNLLISYLAVFALRGVYFALVEESKVHPNITGTAVGFISLVGFTPDVFFGAVSGRILDANVGLKGFENYFLFLMLLAMVGLIAAFILSKMNASLEKNQRAENSS